MDGLTQEQLAQAMALFQQQQQSQTPAQSVETPVATSTTLASNGSVGTTNGVTVDAVMKMKHGEMEQRFPEQLKLKDGSTRSDVVIVGVGSPRVGLDGVTMQRPLRLAMRCVDPELDFKSDNLDARRAFTKSSGSGGSDILSVLVDADEDVIFQPKLNADGTPVVGADGKPVIEQVYKAGDIYPNASIVVKYSLTKFGTNDDAVKNPTTGNSLFFVPTPADVEQGHTIAPIYSRNVFKLDPNAMHIGLDIRRKARELTAESYRSLRAQIHGSQTTPTRI